MRYISVFKYCFVLIAVTAMSSCRCSERKAGTLQSEGAQVMNLQDSVEATRGEDSADRAQRDAQRMEQLRQDEIRDSLTYLTQPHIGASEAAELARVLKRWTDFHKIDIKKFRLSEESPFDAAAFLTPDDPQSVYFEEFDNEYHGNYTPQSRDYSPDGRRYVNVLEATYVYRDKDDGKWYFMGSDDAQKIDFVDLDRKIVKMLVYTGTAFMDGAFWVDNDRFVLAQTLRYENCYQLYYYDLAAGMRRSYILKAPVPEDNGTYLEYDMKRRGITIL